MALENQVVLPNINFDTPNPKSKLKRYSMSASVRFVADHCAVPFQKYKLHVPTEVESWPRDRAERISVNSFGIGGVNAHVS